MDLDTLSLRSFVAVAETGSITKAAEQIGRTQSAVSQQIKKIEQLFNKSFFVRGKQCKLTKDGQLLLNNAKKILNIHFEIIDGFKNPDLRGEVSFGLPEDFAHLYLSKLTSDFIDKHPRILFNIKTDLTLNLFESFRKKELDLVLVKMNQPDDFPNGQEIWTESLEWVGDINLVQRNKPIPLVLSHDPCVYRAGAINVLDKSMLSWRLAVSSTSYVVSIAAIKARMGISVLPRNMIPQDIKIIKSNILPKLNDIHVSLLKHFDHNVVVNSFERFILDKLR
ncbi:MAG: LysR family transcriptional regulator [Rickettsiales bacterium]|nr:LysR family transcriptional regulator [Rickettsiales bacterium]